MTSEIVFSRRMFAGTRFGERSTDDLMSVVMTKEMNQIFFRLIEVSTKKRTGKCINARSALLQKFSVLFSVDTSINRKNIRYIRNRSF